MKNLFLLEEVVLSQRERFFARDAGVQRHIDYSRYMAHDRIVVVSGVRRCGKSTLLNQFARRYDDCHFINFDDERLLDFSAEDFADLMLVFSKLSESKTVFLDEVQNINNWERFVRRIHDEGYKVYLTGSNAKLLSGELATHLTGRYAKIELFPFSFAETLDFKEIEHSRVSTSVKAQLLVHFDRYLTEGGFPEFLKYGDDEFLKRTFDDIIYRDIVQRFGVREVKSFRQVAQHIFSNVTSELSYSKMASTGGLGSAMAVRSYCGYLEESYLTFELFRYDYSVKRQNLSNKKMFVIDNGMRNVAAFRFSKDSGRLLENLVFLELRRRGSRLFFHRDKHECDFLVEERGTISSAVQVCHDMGAHNMDRERHGLAEAMKKFSLKTGTIVTYSQEETIKTPDGDVHIVPAWKWLLAKPARLVPEMLAPDTD